MPSSQHPDRPDPETSTRRGLLRSLMRSTARATKEAAGGAASLGLFDDGSTAAASRIAARVPQRCLSIDELVAAAHAEGLDRRDEMLRTVALRSWRMTSTEREHPQAWVLTDERRLSGAGSEVVVAQIDLDAIARLDLPLPSAGWLVLFVETPAQGTHFSSGPGRGAVLDAPVTTPAGARPVTLTPELVLPRVWHAAIQAATLDQLEHHAYVRLRARVQELQGVEGDEDGDATIAYHRLFGYPDENVGNMPASCAAIHQPRGAGTDERSGSPDAATGAGAWQLLAQVSHGDSERVYIWIDDVDLRAGRFDRLVTFMQ